jgi:BirA family transcriptional regulator, biotin operon repressor / biotin---[acetyl-CoA-carboxylase] ligase
VSEATPIRPRAGSGPLGGPIVHLDVTGSSNDHARRLAQAGAPAGTVVVAEQQTAGRGRQGRTWIAPRGRALTLSIVLRPQVEQLAMLPLASAVAVCEACEQAAAVRCAIKWPNDVLADGKKLAGILIESRPQERWAVIGIGLNVDTPAQEFGAELDSIATSLRIAAGESVSRERVLDTLLDSLAKRVGSGKPESGDALLAAYRERDALIDRDVRWTSGSQTLEGRAAGIDEQGNLVVFTTEGERCTLDAGEVHLLGSES